MGRKASLGNILHALRTNLHLDPHTIGTHHRRMQRLVAIGLRHRDPIAQTIRFGGINIGNGRVDLPALGLLRGEWQLLEDNANGKQVVNLLERNLLALHLAPNRIDTLDAARNLIFDIIAIQGLDDWCIERVDKLLTFGLCFVEFLFDLGILLRKAILHAEILQLGFDGVEAQTIGQGGKQIDRLARDLNLLIERHSPQRTHVVQTVGNLDQDHTHIVREGQQDLAEIFRLLRGVGIKNTRHLGQSIDHRGDFRAKNTLHILDRILRILHHIVQQSRNDRFDTQTDLIHRDLRHSYRMQQIRFSGASSNTLVSLLGQEKCTLNEVPILVVLADIRTRVEQLFPLFLN